MRLMTQDTFQPVKREGRAGKWVRGRAHRRPQFADVLRRCAGASRFAARKTRKSLGQRDFTLKRYHDAVLSYGSPPVRYVRELMLELPIGMTEVFTGRCLCRAGEATNGGGPGDAAVLLPL